MVRINLLEPSALSDQHLIAEYREILLLLGYVRKHEKLSSEGAHFMKQPVKFFGDRLTYLERRHALLRKEMRKRGFRPRIVPSMRGYARGRKRDFIPDAKQVREIKARIANRLRHPPWKGFYHYYRKKVPTSFLVGLVRKAKAG